MQKVCTLNLFLFHLFSKFKVINSLEGMNYYLPQSMQNKVSRRKYIFCLLFLFLWIYLYDTEGHLPVKEKCVSFVHCFAPRDNLLLCSLKIFLVYKKCQSNILQFFHRNEFFWANLEERDLLAFLNRFALKSVIIT